MTTVCTLLAAALLAATQGTGNDSELEAQVARELGAAPAPGSQAPTGAQPPAGTRSPAQAAPQAVAAPAPVTGGNPYARVLLLPDISAIGRAALAWNTLEVGALSPRSDPYAPRHTLRPIFQELEVGLQAVVDPYARADVFLTFTPQGAGVEEAYLTALSLPFGLQARAGELYAPFGRLNQQHPHTWDFVDRPLALARLLAVDGLSGAGFDVAWLAPTPWFAELHLAYQAVTPGLEARQHDTGLARLSQFFDVGTASTLGVGLSAAHAGGSGGEAGRDVVGADVYYKIRPPQTRSSLALQGEALLRRAGDLPAGIAAAGAPPFDEAGSAWGGYLQAVLRDGAYASYGLRLERAPALGGGPELRASVFAGWLPSEFERLRLQAAYDVLPGGRTGVEALLALEFAIGAHGAHPF